MKKEMTCLSCPVGCSLIVEEKKGGGVSVTGNQCPKGEDYALEELRSPKRIVTTTCAIINGEIPRLPVRTDKPLPVQHIQDLLQQLHGLEIPAPIRRGEVLLEKFKDTNINVIASLTVGRGRRTNS